MQKKRAGGSSSNRRGSGGIIGLVKQIMGILSCMVKAKSMELKSKTRELKMRLTIFWLLKDKKVLLGSTHRLSPNLQTLLTHHHHPPPVESTAVTQGGGGEEEEEVERMMRTMMLSKQGIKFVQMYNNNQISMPPVHTTTPNTKTTTMPILDHDYKPTATTEDKDIAYNQEEDLEQEKEQQQDKNDDDEVVDVRIKDQPWMFVEDEVTTDDGSHHCSKDGELVAVLDEDDDNDNINIDEAADLFIRNFRQQLRLQKNQNYYS